MKFRTLVSSTYLLLALVSVGSTLAATPPPITLQYVNPAKFTDFKVLGRDANFTAGRFSEAVREELTPIMKQKYPNGSLVLRFTDIDLAGRYSTGRDVRIMSLGHPARMSFEFQLTDSNGKVLARGSTRLNDNSNPSSQKYDPKRSQPFYYERRALNRWLRTLAVSK